MRSRFRVVSHLGRGASGDVYAAHDTLLEQTVALKTIRDSEAEGTYQLKREFRRLSDLRHPNLVRLYEFFHDGAIPFFTMELVAGTDFLEFVGGRSVGSPRKMGGSDYERLRDSIRQLAAGLAYMHGKGVVHRDIKPHNVLVERTGRVTILDFGLASDIRSDLSRRSRAGNLAGTFAYMSPEQAYGAELTPASDWYSVGTMLFEAVTGRLPLPLGYPRDLFERWEQPVPRPKDVVGDVPDDIDDLVVRLLDRDPAQRPAAAEIRDRLESWKPHPTPPVTPALPPRFVGRKDELDRLRTALAESRHHPVLVEVTGPSGIGKTALVRHFLEEAARESVVGLGARCHPRETVPFKSIDGLVDDLTRVLDQEQEGDAASFLPRHHSSLLATFPVMGRVAAFSAAPAGEIPRERGELRRRAFEALREVIARLADRRPVVLWIDDGQWGEADGLSVLTHLVREPDPPSVLVVVSHRPPAEQEESPDGSDLVEPLRKHVGAKSRIALPPVSDEEVTDLVRMEWMDLGNSCEDRLPDVVAEAGGNPFLAIELARSTVLAGATPPGAAPLLASLVAMRLASLEASARDVLELLAVAGHPLDVAVVAGPFSRSRKYLWALSEAQFVSLVPRGPGSVVCFQHDRLRDAVLAAIEPRRLRAFHRELASTFEATPGRYDDSLVDHWLAAEMPERASEAAVRLADGAVAVGAFARAATLYRRAIELRATRQPRWLLLAKYARALADDGRLSEAAEGLEDAARELAREDSQDLQRAILLGRAASAHLHAGHHAEGFAALDQAGRIAGVAFPRSRVAALWQMAKVEMSTAARERIARRRPTVEASDPRKRAQLELCWEAARSLRFIDSIRSAAYAARHGMLARRLEDPRHVSRALGVQALMRAFRNGEGDWSRTEAILIEAERLAEETGDPHVIGHARLMRATVLSVNTRWADALAEAERGEQYWRAECRGAGWELATLQQNALLCLSMRGRLGDVKQRMLQYLAEARDRGDEFAASVLPIGIPNLAWLGADDPDEAERRVDEAIGREEERENTWLLYNEGHARGHIVLYRGDADAAHSYVARVSKVLRRRGLLRIPSIAINYADLRARCALLAAEQASEPAVRDRWLRLALSERTRILRARTSWAMPFADRIQGVVAGLRGETDEARRWLERAALGLQHQGLDLLAAGTRYRLSRFLPAGPAEEMREAAVRWMREHGTTAAERMVPLC